MANRSPLHEKRSKVRNLRPNEDFKYLKTVLTSDSRVYFDPYFSTTLSNDKEWRRPKNICRYPTFVDGKLNRFDALQGDVGDCWLISAMEAMTLNDELANHVVPRDQGFTHDYCGVFHFRIWQLGVWYDVVVDDQLPVNKNDGSLCYAHSRNGDVFWAALLEKAYAKVCTVLGDKGKYEYLETGSPLTALQDLSGAIVEVIVLQSPPSNITIHWLFQQVSTGNCLMTCCIKRDTDLGLLKLHNYAITRLFEFSDDDRNYKGLFLVRIMNPWGFGEWRGWWSDDDYYLWRQVDRSIREKLEVVVKDDGEFWMDERDFTRRYQYLYMCHFEPGDYLERHKLHQKFGTWSTAEIHGEWVRYYTAAGVDLSTRHKNPQYMFLLKKPKDISKESKSYKTVIDLVHRSKDGRQARAHIAFFIYVSSIMPLNRDDMLKLRPLDVNPDFESSDERTYVMSTNLRPGRYIIVPCTYYPHFESRFLLRVFSECDVIPEARYDMKISKSLPTAEQNNIEYNAMRMFNESASGEDGMDWIGLKRILEVTMNPNRSFFGKFVSFVKYIGESFGINISPRSSDDHDSGHVVFTKDECRKMIAMLDVNNSGKLSVSEFCSLWNKICFWSKVYDQHKDDDEGYVKLDQLRDALSTVGYDVTTRTVHSLSYVYANEYGLLCLTDFILCGVTLETVLSLVDKAEVKDKSQIIFTLEEWVKNTLMF